MTPDDALLALVVGDEQEQQQAKEVLWDRYFASLLSRLQGACQLPPEVASIGASQAFLEFFEKAPDIVGEGLNTTTQLGRWLFLRGHSRAMDELRQQARLRGLEEDSTPLAADHSLLQELGDRELVTSVLDFAARLDQPDRGILLNLLVKRDVVDQEQAAAVDSELISCLGEWEIYSVEALRKRRTRLLKVLQERYRELQHER